MRVHRPTREQPLSHPRDSSVVRPRLAVPDRRTSFPWSFCNGNLGDMSGRVDGRLRRGYARATLVSERAKQGGGVFSSTPRSTSGDRGSIRGRARRTLARLMPLGAALLAFPAAAEATLPGKNGGFAYAFELDYETDDVSYTVFSWRVGLIDQDGDNRHFVVGGAEPAFGPGGRMLAVSRVGGSAGGWGIAALPLSGKPVKRVSFDVDSAPSWSPSGRRLVFEKLRCTGIEETEYCPRRRQGLWTAGRAGGEPRQLIPEGSDPAWSSRNQIAFVRTAEDFYATGEIGIVSPHGGEARTLTSGWQPDWSPSGRRLAFWDKNGIFVINRNGGDRRRLYFSRHGPRSPTWSPDGRKIAFLLNEAVFAVPSSGGRARRLFGLPCPAGLCGDDFGSYQRVTGLAWQPLPARPR
jgi:hypothetical protein